ncbi:hypothetical protein SAMN05216337_104576 [Bradyrhizobium brasilense]|uniref:Uncharacterized protein n=1 Tax=Bradyrhizobium brasilense TaxID=1419277 RepID=A0A1G7ILK7_9BRAD|nr:hypothetical protein SAMN05216337_104576 [Bradyrhizobium brasilense]
MKLDRRLRPNLQCHRRSIMKRVASGEDVGVQAMSLLRLCLGSMGMTPAYATKVSWAPNEELDDLD